MLLLRAFSRLHFSILYALSGFLFFLSYHILKYRRGVVRQNLANSFPKKSEQELRIIERKFYHNLCDYAVETLKLLTISQHELHRRVVFTNADTIKEYTNSGQSVIILAAHQFNWEWLLAAGCFSLPVPVDFVYQPQSSELANRFSMAMRTRFGGYAVKRETVGREALKRKDIVRATAIVADQFPGHYNHRRYWTKFLGQQTAFFHGLAQLAVLTDSAVYYAAILKTGRGHYEVTLKKLTSPPYDEPSSLQVVEQYVKESEKIIHQQPEGWLWSHKRWKDVDEIVQGN